jgi:hypothetical protein
MFPDDDAALQARWANRQERLRARVDELGGTGLDHAADLSLGRFWWRGIRSLRHPVEYTT